ncbi:MAG: DUF3592 domain-containing protein [Bacteroidales bacterium]|nr:DUF3592 domain-containing protein [Bacteroidales bacterium]
MKKKLNSGLFAILMGIVLIGVSIYSYYQTDEFIDSAKETTGVVVDVYIKKNTSTNNDKKVEKTEYCPIIEFATEEGDTIEFKSTSGSTNFDYYKVGKEIEVMYDPENPSKARIKTTKKANNRNVFIMAGMGILIIVGGIGKSIFDKKKNQGIA